MNLSPYIANLFARWIAGQGMPAAPTELYLGLWSGNPLDGGSEVGAAITGSSARVQMPVALPADDGESNVVFGDGDADFGASASVTPVSVGYITVSDHPTAGNFLAVKELETPRTVHEGDNVRIRAEDFELEIEAFSGD